ncbi:Pr6Pr family membrane protein [Rathayibacter tritici]|uniref:Integral membrane protein n=1 Tax=Rathayibacter tritici TaxID=33888 RepID=A0A161J380_9MICO|nr:Pr6Pr family membrane protein [Rathayibacter tritici]AND17175.1 hypothetical protein A6122_2051 [Rathayibacter tritici]
MSSLASTRPFVGAARVAVGAAAIAVILHTYALSIAVGDSNPFDYFGYFTNQTSLLASAVLIVAGSVALARRPTPVWLSYVRGASTAYLIVVAVIYNTLVPGTGSAPPWVSAVLHLVLPALVLLDWTVAADCGPLSWRRLWVLLPYPIIWVIVVLVRGATDGWVPYGFLLPANGALSLVVHVAGLTCAVLLAGALVWALSRRRRSAG